MGSAGGALVTGAGGFVGSHLVERLVSDGVSVRAFVRYTSTGRAGWLDSLPADVRDSIEIVSGDVRDDEAVTRAMAGVDRVFHLAALIGIPYSYLHPRDVVDTNVGGTLNILIAARAAGVERVVHASTSEVYGSARSVPIGESHALHAQSPYAASKIGAEKLVESFHASYGLPAVVLRPFNIYGPRQSARAVVPAVISQALARDEIRLGAGAPTRDFNFVEDTVDAFVRASRAPGAVGGVFNVGTGREISIADMANLAIRLAGREGGRLVTDEMRLRPAASEVTRLCADSRRAREVLGWEPQTTLEEGLRTTIDWFSRRSPTGDPAAYAI
jgi:NAD dependent epimerase/dehydratase